MSSRKKPITKQMKLERRKQADKRNEEYAKLSLQQKLDKLPAGSANKQRARLEAAVEAAKKPAKVEAKAKTDLPVDAEAVDTNVVEKSKPKKGKKQS